MKKQKVLMVGDAVIDTGFGRVTNSLVKYLREDFDISILGVNYWGDPHDLGVKVYPAGTKTPGDLYGYTKLPRVLGAENPDIIFIFNDIWVINTYLIEIKKYYSSNKQPFPKIVIYFPVDAKDHDPDWYANLDAVNIAVVYNQFGLSVAKQAKEFNYRVIGHGVDSEDFYKINDTKENLRRKLFSKDTSFDDAFIVLNANRNQPRKRLDLTILGFAQFARNKPENVKLYMHSGYMDAHINTAKLATRLGIDKRLILTTTNVGPQVVSKQMLNTIYNICDVGINTSLGEGFGLTPVEHAATGAAQIVPNSSASGELFSDCGLLLDRGHDFLLDTIYTTGYLVNPDEVAEKLEMLYNDRVLLNTLGEKARAKFTSKEFSWEYIAGQWKELFRELK